MTDNEKKLRLIKLLLEKANSIPDTHEGESARQMAYKYMAELKISEADITATAHLVLGPKHKPWENALCDLVFARAGYPCTWSPEKGATVMASKDEVETSKEVFTELRRAVLLASSLFSRSLKMTIDIAGIFPIVDTFCNYVVLGMAQSMLVDLRFSDMEMPRLDRLLDDPGAGNIDYSVPAPSGHRGGRGAGHRTVRLSPGPAGLEAATRIVPAVM